MISDSSAPNNAPVEEEKTSEPVDSTDYEPPLRGVELYGPDNPPPQVRLTSVTCSISMAPQHRHDQNINN